MICKVLFIAAALGVAAAQYHQASHGHGHAVSSQNVVLHQSHGHAPVISHHAYQPVAVLHHQPAQASHGHYEEHHAPAHYAFEYSVEDKHTGDIKSQHETREGDAVKGYYSLHEADGTVRRVEYTADKHSGFNAVVHREGKATHAVPVHYHH
ncbi:uncharacterized protein [Epargyreus clarus]|uniref:uncharacterized protein n=1 Tax=Epargyreus clarus TaxID=520877 RepID=UPI003C2D3487